MSTAPSPPPTVEEIAHDRHSVRAFTRQEVDASVIGDIIEVAQRAPSWCNVQPWTLDLLSGEAKNSLVDRMLADADRGPGQYDIPAPSTYSGVYRDRRRASGFRLYEAVGVDRADMSGRSAQARENFRFFGAPHALIISCASELLPYGLVDCGAFIATFQLAAQSKGVGTIAQAAVARYGATIREFLGLSSEQRIVGALAFGYADTDHPVNSFRTERATVTDAVRCWRAAGRTPT